MQRRNNTRAAMRLSVHAHVRLGVYASGHTGRPTRTIPLLLGALPVETSALGAPMTRPEPEGPLLPRMGQIPLGAGLRSAMASAERRRLRRRHHPNQVLPDGTERREAHPVARTQPLQDRGHDDAGHAAEVAGSQGDHRLGQPGPLSPRRPQVPQIAAKREDQTAHRQGTGEVRRPAGPPLH